MERSHLQTALKGREMIAQGAALGFSVAFLLASPEGAKSCSRGRQAPVRKRTKNEKPRRGDIVMLCAGLRSAELTAEALPRLPAFAWMVRLSASLLLRTDPELALYGRYLISSRLRDDGFEFRFPHLRKALADLFATSG